MSGEMDAYQDERGRRHRRRGLPSAKNAAQAPDLFSQPATRSMTEPRSRGRDRATSHEAAKHAATGDLSKTQSNILHIVRTWVRERGVGITDDQILIEFQRLAKENPTTVRCPSSSRVRTARADLVALKRIQDTGQLGSSALGNQSTTWEPAPEP